MPFAVNAAASAAALDAGAMPQVRPVVKKKGTEKMMALMNKK